MTFYDKVMNFMADHTKEEMKTEGGVKYPASDFAFVPDKTKPSTWKLRMSEGEPGNITIAQLGRAAAAFSPGGFRGKQVEIPQDKVASVKRKLRAEYRKLDAKPPDSIKSKETSLTVWKEKDTYKFIAVYSNNFRDNDNPPEIISEKSHRRFDEMLSKGEIPYPELWLWHVPEWKCGQVTSHAYDDSGFAIAFGEFDKGKEAIAEWYMNSKDIRMSHGMPSGSIVRDENDASVIIEHVTREVSLLPAQSAANKLTGFAVLNKEEKMIPENKRDALVEQGIDPETLAKVEAINAETSQQAKESGLEHKETEDVSEVVETANESADVESVEDDGDTSEVAITRDEIVDAINESNKAVYESLKERDALIQTLAEQVQNLTKALTEKQEEKAASTPAMSILDMLRGQSVIGTKEVEVTEDDNLPEGPKEQKEKDTPKLSSIPFINSILAQSAK